MLKDEKFLIKQNRIEILNKKELKIHFLKNQRMIIICNNIYIYITISYNYICIIIKNV